MRRFVLGWKLLGHEQRLGARVVNYADDLVICCRGNGTEAMAAMRGMMQKLKLTVNEGKTHLYHVPNESVDFLGYTIGRCYSPRTGWAYIGTRPSRKSVQRVCREVSVFSSARSRPFSTLSPGLKNGVHFKYPKAVASLLRDREKLLTFYDFPAAHWQSIRSTNVVESAFATVRLRQRVTTGAGSRARGLIMAFKLLAMAENRWRRIRNPHLVKQLIEGKRFVDGESATNRTQETRKSAA